MRNSQLVIFFQSFLRLNKCEYYIIEDILKYMWAFFTFSILPVSLNNDTFRIGVYMNISLLRSISSSQKSQHLLGVLSNNSLYHAGIGHEKV
jgi:hypothetical protein